MKRSRLVLPPKEYKKLCRQVHERDGWRCKNCKSRSNLHAHHIVFRSHGGDDASYNLITVCNECHDLIHGHSAAKGLVLIVVAITGDLNEQVNADVGVKFLRVVHGKVQL